MNVNFRKFLAWAKFGARTLAHLLDFVDDVSTDVSDVRAKAFPIPKDEEE